MSSVIVIPARYGSTRFEGKPLALIHGKSMLLRTWSLAKAVPEADEVYVATDDDRIETHVKEFGGACIRTPAECRNGTERVYEAVKSLDEVPEIILNLQGDAVLTPPHVLSALIESLKTQPEVGLHTPAVELSEDQLSELEEAKLTGKSSGTLVVFDKDYRALYFSKSVIPFQRTKGVASTYRHIGLYGYRWKTLQQLLTIEPGPLELAEQLEQLRALENGISIQVILVDYGGRTAWSVDRPEDISFVEKIIDRDGELVKFTS